MTFTATAVRPQPGPTRDYSFPAFERRQISSDLKLIVAPVQKLPIATVLVLLDAGAVTEPKGKEGIAHITASAITEGTKTLDGEALTNQLEQLGTSIDAAADWDATTISLTVLTDKLPQAFAHLASVLTTPTFPDTAIERIKGERLAEILQTASEPRELADEMFDTFLYAEGSRFTTPVGGTKETVAALTRQDVVDFYTARYRPGGATVIVVGDVTVDDAETMVRDALHAWNGAPAAMTPVNDAPARTTRAIHIVRKGDAPQSELRIGHIAVPRTHPDYFALTVMNAVLGGLFSSRINLNLREAHGYTYGAFSELDWRKAAGPFLVSTAVASNVTAPAITEALHEIEKMSRDEITESELSLATSYLDGVFPIRYETTSAIAAALATLTVYQLPDDWYDTYRERVRAVTTGDVLAAMQAHIHSDRLQIVVVGNASEIEAPLQALDFGPITVSDASNE